TSNQCRIIHTFVYRTKMNTDSICLAADDYIRAASDPQLSSPDSHLLTTLLSEEDQHEYNQLLQIQIAPDALNIVNQVRSLFTLQTRRDITNEFLV
ncbi:unnamed protein product, partial [Rotaria socialis]